MAVLRKLRPHGRLYTLITCHRSLVTSDDLLKPRIFAQWVPQRIDPKISESFAIRYFEKMRQSSDGGIDIAKLGLDFSQNLFSGRFNQSVCGVISDGMLRLLQSFVLFAKAGIYLGEIDRQLSRIDRDD